MNVFIPENYLSKFKISSCKKVLVNHVRHYNTKNPEFNRRMALSKLRKPYACGKKGDAYLFNAHASQPSSHKGSFLDEKPDGYEIPTKPDNSKGVVYVELPAGTADAFLAITVIVLWCFSVARLIIIWQENLSFSEATFRGIEMGWGVVASWIDEKIRKRNLKVFE